MSWDNLKTFNNKLKGQDVFRAYDRQSVMDFLSALDANPAAYGISLVKHQKGVQELYKRLIKRPTAAVPDQVTVEYYGTKLNIRDFDTALGYIFSVCPLPKGATPNDTYLPLLVIYCKFISLMTDEDGGTGMQNMPATACCVVGSPPGSGDVKSIMFGASIRLSNKRDLQRYRFDQLKDAYHVMDTPLKSSRQKYGHCAETYPYICNIKISSPYVFVGQVQGIAVEIEEVVGMTKFAPLSFKRAAWKPPCPNCVELLTLGKQRPYDCFPHEIGHRN